MEKKFRIRGSSKYTEATERELVQLVLRGALNLDTEVALFPTEQYAPIQKFPYLLKMIEDQDSERTIVFQSQKSNFNSDQTKVFDGSISLNRSEQALPEILVQPEVQSEATRMIERPGSGGESKAKRKSWVPPKRFLLLFLLVFVFYEEYYEKDTEQEVVAPPVFQYPDEKVLPKLPALDRGTKNPKQAEKLYQESLVHFAKDTVTSYRKAILGFQLALQYDPNHLKALSLLAVSYFQLAELIPQTDSSFAVLNKLVDYVRAKNVSILETLMAEVEFYAYLSRWDVALEKLLEFSRNNTSTDPMVHFYYGWVYQNLGDTVSAARFYGNIQQGNLPFARAFAAKAQLSFQLKQNQDALVEIKNALTLEKNHPKSLLLWVKIQDQQNQIIKAKEPLGFLLDHPATQLPSEYVEALVMGSRYALSQKQFEMGREMLEKARSLQPDRFDVQMEYYSLVATLPNPSPQAKDIAKMYSLVIQAKEKWKENRAQEALVFLIQAQDLGVTPEVPLEVMGEVLLDLGDARKALEKLKQALALKPKRISLISKVVTAAIRVADYKEASIILAKYRSVPEMRSEVDRLSGDLLFAQGAFAQALSVYRRSMLDPAVNSSVYLSTARTLMNLGRCRDAQFYYSIALKQQLDRYPAVKGYAQCLQEIEGSTSAQKFLQSELLKGAKPRADLLTLLAELQLRDGNRDRAWDLLDQAERIEPDFPDTYRVKGEVLKLKPGRNKDETQRMLDAFKRYSDLSRESIYGYEMRFDYFLSKSMFSDAELEIERMFSQAPSAQGIYLKRAQLMRRMGKIKEAKKDIEYELEKYPRSVDAFLERGEIELLQNQLDDAQVSFSKVVEMDTRNAKGKIGLGYVLYKKKMHNPAIALFLAAMSLDPGAPEVYRRLGHAYYESGDIATAKKYFQKYLDLSPDAVDREMYQKILR